MSGFRVHQFHGFPLAAIFGCGEDAEVAQGEVAVAGPAGAVVFHSGVREGLDTEGVESGCFNFGGEYPPIACGVFSAQQK